MIFKSRKTFLLLVVLLLSILPACTPTEDPVGSEEAVIPDTTVVMSETVQAELTEVSATSLVFATGSALVSGVEVGDVLVGELSAVAPDGFVRKVLEVQTDAGQTTFVTQEASLLEAIESGSLSARIELKPEDIIETTSHLPFLGSQAILDGFSRSFTNEVIFDLDDDEETTNDQVRATGLFEIKPVLDVDLDIGFFSVESFEARIGIEQHAELEIIAEFEDNLKKEIKLFTHKFTPYLFTIGPVPIYIQPTLTVSLGVDGEIKAVATFTSSQDAELIAGVAYDESTGFENISSADFAFSDTNADFEGELKTEAYISAELKITVNGLVKAYGEARASLEIDGKIPRDPTWILEGCFEVLVGAEIDYVFDEASFDDTLLKVCREIGRADNTPPKVEIVNPSDGRTIDLNLETTLNASGSDAEDGLTLFCCDYQWESNREGVLATGPGARVAFTELGEHDIKVTITDSKGATSTDTITINVVNSIPTVSIVKPLASTTVFRGSTVTFLASSFDLNEPDAKLSCDQLVWTSSVASDALPKSGCEIELAFTSNGTRTIVLTGTDSQGAVGGTKLNLTVIDPPENLPPVVRITSPTSGSSLNLNALLSLIGTATDPEGNNPLSFEWTAQLNGATPIVLDNASSTTWTPSDSFDFSDEGRYELKLSLNATDSLGNTGSDFVVFVVNIIN